MEPCSFVDCLEHSVTENGSYTHRLLYERAERRSQLLSSIQAKVQRAHEDARRRLRRLAGISLDPLGTSSFDPAFGYPGDLPSQAQKGCFGEVLAGTIAETFPHFGLDGWCVPAYAFRFHKVAFDYLERRREGGDGPRQIPGRVGDDVLAFRKNESGVITQALVCEAKCTNGHDASMIAEAHEKASEPNMVPVDVPQLIEILEDYDDAESSSWLRALRLLYNRSQDALNNYERCDLVSYTCGQKPIRNSTWIAIDTPHAKYTGARRFEAVELHLTDIDDLVSATYSAGELTHVST